MPLVPLVEGGRQLKAIVKRLSYWPPSIRAPFPPGDCTGTYQHVPVFSPPVPNPTFHGYNGKDGTSLLLVISETSAFSHFHPTAFAASNSEHKACEERQQHYNPSSTGSYKHMRSCGNNGIVQCCPPTPLEPLRVSSTEVKPLSDALHNHPEIVSCQTSKGVYWSVLWPTFLLQKGSHSFEGNTDNSRLTDADFHFQSTTTPCLVQQQVFSNWSSSKYYRQRNIGATK